MQQCPRMANISARTYSLEGRESVEDGNRPGRPQTSHIFENIEKVSRVERKNSLQTTAVFDRISSATCYRIDTKDINIHWVCPQIVSLMLNEDQSPDQAKSASQAESKDMAKN
ncbi:hypothetical protein TNCV_240061 [Trichonephila clavipes]|nr:hypothetical protein TNCV_240061 [Trichonephila clavipes]